MSRPLASKSYIKTRKFITHVKHARLVNRAAIMAFATQNTGQGGKNQSETAQQQSSQYREWSLSDKYVVRWNHHTALNIQDLCSV